MGIELGLAGLVASPFAHWAILLVPVLYMQTYLPLGCEICWDYPRTFQRTRERSEGWISLSLLWGSSRVRQELVLTTCQCVSECCITVNKCHTFRKQTFIWSPAPEDWAQSWAAPVTWVSGKGSMKWWRHVSRTGWHLEPGDRKILREQSPNWRHDPNDRETS